MAENDRCSRSVALAPESNTSIVDHSFRWLRYLRDGGLPHQLIAAAWSVDPEQCGRSKTF